MGKRDLEVLEARIAEGEKKERKRRIQEMKKEHKKRRKGFFADFKKFITRGNVLDMAVGVIVGGAFTAIINALSTNVLKPCINWVLAKTLGKDSLSEVFTFLTKITKEDGTVDLENSIYIDWGAFINAIINFFLIAITLFIIVRTINRVRARMDAKALAEEEAKKAEEAEKKKAADAAEAEKLAAEKAALEQMYANIARQTELLEKLANK